MLKALADDGESPTEQWLHWQAFADYKYDAYEQYIAGRRFTESLLLWLSALPPEVRLHLHNLVRDRLIYFSSSEMHHFVRMAFFDIIRPQMLREAAPAAHAKPWELPKVQRLPLFKQRERSCLYLGMSDGAHLATFRRHAALHNEQAATTFELDKERLKSLSADLDTDMATLGGPAAGNKFNRVVLLDDFTASGKTYIRFDKKKGKWAGKITKFAEKLAEKPHECDEQTSPDPCWADLVVRKGLVVHIVFYIAARSALQTIRSNVEAMRKEVLTDFPDIDFIIDAVQELPDECRLDRADAQLAAAIDACYDGPAVETRATKVGETTDVKYGFADCALPVILFHNTPNNSIALLWSPETARVAGLFPRITRHRDEV